MGDWKSFADDSAAMSKRAYQECGVRTMLNSLHKEQAAEVEAAMARPEVTARGLRKALALRIEGRLPAPNTINRHRRGECRCVTGEQA